MELKYLLLFVVGVFIASFSQVLLKISANKGYEGWIREYLNIYVVTGYFIFFVSTILVILGYRGVKLKFGPILQSLGYVFILIFSHFFLNESITRKKVFGVILIVLGLVIFSL